VKPGAAVIGVDVGVKDLLVVADTGGHELERHRAPRELKVAHRKLQALQRKASRQIGPWDPVAKARRDPSCGWLITQRDIRRAHARVAALRADRIHKLTTTSPRLTT
jgi:putative transposase